MDPYKQFFSYLSYSKYSSKVAIHNKMHLMHSWPENSNLFGLIKYTMNHKLCHPQYKMYWITGFNLKHGSCLDATYCFCGAPRFGHVNIQTQCSNDSKIIHGSSTFQVLYLLILKKCVNSSSWVQCMHQGQFWA